MRICNTAEAVTVTTIVAMMIMPYLQLMVGWLHRNIHFLFDIYSCVAIIELMALLSGANLMLHELLRCANILLVI